MPQLEGWSSVHGRGADGSIESDERLTAAAPVVERSEAGAQLLGDRYWREVAFASRGLVRARSTGDGIELRLFGAVRYSFASARPRGRTAPITSAAGIRSPAGSSRGAPAAP